VWRRKNPGQVGVPGYYQFDSVPVTVLWELLVQGERGVTNRVGRWDAQDTRQKGDDFRLVRQCKVLRHNSL
jgi:hypothetical protein